MEAIPRLIFLLEGSSLTVRRASVRSLNRLRSVKKACTELARLSVSNRSKVVRLSV